MSEATQKAWRTMEDRILAEIPWQKRRSIFESIIAWRDAEVEEVRLETEKRVSVTKEARK